MTAVLKYTLEHVSSPQEVSMPEGARIVHVASQHDYPTIWAECEPTAPQELRTFVILPTGQGFTFPEGGRYVGTTLTMGGTFVWHVYEVGS